MPPKTSLGLADARVVGFYTLVVSEVGYDDAPDRLTKGPAQHPVPLMLPARLASCRCPQFSCSA
jgi:hypothetical protein